MARPYAKAHPQRNRHDARDAAPRGRSATRRDRLAPWPGGSYIGAMHGFTPIVTDDKSRLHADLLAAASALVAGEPDPIANMANVAALI